MVWPMPVSTLLYAGRKTTDALHGLGIHTIGELAQSDRLVLGKKLGKSGDLLWRYANGMDNEPVASFYAPKEIKSVGNSMTFAHDIKGEQEIRAGISLLADSVAGRLRADGLKCRAVQVQIKDPNFKVIQRQKTLPRPTYLYRELVQAAMELILANWSLNAPIRLLSVTGSDLVPADETAEQVMFFDVPDTAHHEKLEKLEDAMASIREKYGKSSIGFGQKKKPGTGAEQK
jgi:DNA polymerase-4